MRERSSARWFDVCLLLRPKCPPVTSLRCGGGSLLLLLSRSLTHTLPPSVSPFSPLLSSPLCPALLLLAAAAASVFGVPWCCPSNAGRRHNKQHWPLLCSVRHSRHIRVSNCTCWKRDGLRVCAGPCFDQAQACASIALTLCGSCLSLPIPTALQWVKTKQKDLQVSAFQLLYYQV